MGAVGGDMGIVEQSTDTALTEPEAALVAELETTAEVEAEDV
jgi:hypothetical protein